MKKSFLKLLSLIFVPLLLAGCSSSAVVKIGADSYKIDEKIESLEGYKKVASSGNLELYLDSANGLFAIRNTDDNSEWNSTVLDADNDTMAGRMVKLQMQSTMIIYYHDSKNGEDSNTNSNTGADFEIGKIKNGFCIYYTFEYLKMTIPLEIYLEDGALVANIDFNKAVFEDENILITKIEMLPYFCSAASTDEGYLFVPEGSGALINFNNGKQSLNFYERRIYGEEPTDETEEFALKTDNQNITLPVFGVKRGNSAIVAVAENGAESGIINAYTNFQKSSVSNIFSAYQLTSSMNYSIGSQKSIVYDNKGMSENSLKMRYYLLSGDDANYSGMARKYREYLDGKFDFSDYKSDTELFTEIYGGVAKKVSHFGVITNDIIPLTTAAQADKIVNELNEKGINPTVNYREWNTRQIKGQRVDKFSLSSSLQKGGLKLKDFAEKNNVTIGVMNFDEFYDGNIFSNMFNASFSLMGLPYQWEEFSVSTLQESGGAYSRMAGNKLIKYGNELVNSTAKKGYNSMAFSDIANSLYCDYKGDRYYRADIAKAYCKILENANKKLDVVMLSRPNAYALPYADFVFDTPINHSNHVLLDEAVPFYAIVVSEFVDYSSPAFNNSNYGDKINLLSMISGCMPAYSWIYENETILLGTKLSNLSNVNYKATFNDGVKAAEDYAELKKAVKDASIYSHEFIEADLSATVYENGVTIYVNLSNFDKTTPDGSVVSANSFVIKGE